MKMCEKYYAYSEMEILEINLTKDSSLLLYAIHNVSTGGFLKKTRLYSGLKNTRKKHETTKLKSICDWHFVDRKNLWQKTRENRESEETQAYVQKPCVKIPFKSSKLGPNF